MKLPSWAGYWFWCIPVQSILIHTKDGKDIDVRSTECPDYTFTNICSDEWIFANDTNCPALGGEATFSFSEAIKYLKRGMKVAREGWNGKKQYIQLATGISYKTADGEIVNCEHDDIENMAISFVGTSGVQMGWLASQADMLAEDWVFAEQEDFQSVCKKKLVEWYRKNRPETPIDLSNVFVVWSCKTLQNYKCLASTDISGDGIYAEYIYNGDKQELYEDVYGKITNACHAEE